MNPDLGFGRSISYEAHLKHALIQMETGRKGDDSAVPRDKPIISPRTVSAGEGPLEKRGGRSQIPRDARELFDPRLLGCRVDFP